jgi:glutathionylspermidine synthase
VSTRRTKWLWWRFHLFTDVSEDGLFLDIGGDSYNRAWKVWPLTFMRLY